MKKIIFTIIGTILALFIAGQIFITNETLASFIFSILYFGLNIALILFVGFIVHMLITLFGMHSHFSSDSGGINKVGFYILIVGIIVLIFILKYINSYEVKDYLNNVSIDLSNHIEIEKGKMPIFHIGDTK